MNLIANGLTEPKTFLQKTMNDLWAITGNMQKTFGLGTHIPVKHINFDEPITVQIIENDIVTFCNHDGAEVGVAFNSYYDNLREDMVDIATDAFLCDKCEAWQDIEGEWHE